VKLGDQAWRTSTVKGTCDPKWPEDETHDFVVYDRTQLLSINVMDDDSLNADDRLGQPEPLEVIDALKKSGKEVPVFEKAVFIRRGAAYTTGPGRGDLLMRYTWLEPTPGDEERRKKASGEGYLLIADISRLTLPASLAKRVQVRFAVDGRKTHSRYVRTPAAQVKNAVDAVDKVILNVVYKGAERGLSAKTLSELTGLSETMVGHILKEGDSSKARDDITGSLVAASVNFDSHLAIPLKARHVQSDTEMTVEIRDHKRNIVAHTQVKLASVPTSAAMSSASNVRTVLDLKSRSKLEGAFRLELQFSLHELKPGELGQKLK